MVMKGMTVMIRRSSAMRVTKIVRMVVSELVNRDIVRALPAGGHMADTALH